MAESSWPSPTYNTGAVTNAEYERLHTHEGAGLLGYYGDTPLIFADSSGLLIKVRADRRAYIRGYTWYSGTGDVSVAISSNASGSTRVDRIVLRLDRSTWNVRIAVITGTPGGGAPAWTQSLGTSGLFEISLALVTVVNGASTIAAADVVFHGMFYAPRPMIGNTNAVPWAMNTAFSTYSGMLWIDSSSTQMRIHDTSDTGILARYADTGLINGSAAIATGFAVAGNGIRYQTRNQATFLSFDIQRTGANLATGTSTTILTLPTGYRPAVGFFVPVKLTTTTGSAARVFINSTGVVQLDSLDGALNTGGYVSGSSMFPTTI